MSPIKRMTSAFSSAGDRSSRFPGGDMPLQNLKSLYAESPDLPIFTRAVSPCPLQLRQQNLRCPDFCPYYIYAPTLSNRKNSLVGVVGDESLVPGSAGGIIGHLADAQHGQSVVRG